MIETDICVIGAGPVGLFSVFEAGLLKMRCHLVDVLPQIGGQLSEIYPKKPIYDIPGYPEINAEDLAPGGNAGRLTLFTESAIERLGKEKLFTRTPAAQPKQKKAEQGA